MNKSKHRIVIPLACIAVWSAVLTGCKPAQRKPDIAPIATPQSFRIHTIGYSVEKRPIDLYSAGSGSDKTLIIATIHGNEQAGTSLVHRLMDRIRQRPDLLNGRTILIIPVANPDGVLRNTRGNANDIDLNRNFPADNRQNSDTNGFFPLSEPESKALFNVLDRYRPARIVSMHQPLKCIDYDGPAERLAYHMAAYCALPVKKLGARPGSFGSFAGELRGIPIITLEMERADDYLTTDQLWQRYGMALIAAIMYPKTPY